MQDLGPRPPVAGRCTARVWAGGLGSQCSRRPLADAAFCLLHQRQAVQSASGLPAHGRVDGPVPTAKLWEFESARESRLLGRSCGTASSHLQRQGTVSLERISCSSVLRWSLRPRNRVSEPEFNLVQPSGSNSDCTSEGRSRSRRRSRSRWPRATSSKLGRCRRSTGVSPLDVSFEGCQPEAEVRQPFCGACVKRTRRRVAARTMRVRVRQDAPLVNRPNSCRGEEASASPIKEAPLEKRKRPGRNEEGAGLHVEDIRAANLAASFTSFCPESAAPGQCRARIWADGRGAQCSRLVQAGAEFCKQHERRRHHGRIDGEVPDSKLAEFLRGYARVAAMEGKPCEERHKENPRPRRFDAAEAVKVSDAPFSFYHCKRAGGVKSATDGSFDRRTRCVRPEISAVCQLIALPEEACFHIMQCLQQAEIFRSAGTSRTLAMTARQPRLYHCVDLRAVGRSRAPSGRQRTLTFDAGLRSLAQFLLQRRFAQAVELELGGSHVRDLRKGTCFVLQIAAQCCLQLRVLRLFLEGGACRKLPPAFIRDLREWWLDRPLLIECGGQTYNVA